MSISPKPKPDHMFSHCYLYNLANVTSKLEPLYQPSEVQPYIEYYPEPFSIEEYSGGQGHDTRGLH
jgi:hypothetical protein